MLKKGDYVLFKATPPLLCGCAEVFCLLQTDEVHAAVLSVSDLVQHSPREHFAKWKPRADTFEVMVADAIGLQQGRRWDDYHIVAHAHLCFTHLKHGFAEDGKNQQVRLRTSRKLMQP
eukprot:s5096_g1.t1